MKRQGIAFAVLAGCSLIAQQSVGVMIRNSAFEESEEGRPVGWQAPRTMYVGAKAGHNGSGGLVWESKEPQKSKALCEQEIEFEHGMAYRFSCFVKMEGVKSGRACICLEWYDEKGEWLSGGYTHGFTGPDLDWTFLEGACPPIPREAKSAKIILHVLPGTSGRVYFDAVDVSPLERPAVAFLFSSVYRNVVAEGPVRIHAVLYPPKSVPVSDLVAEFRYLGADGSRKTVRPAVGAEETVLEVDSADIATGTHPVECSLCTRDGKRLGKASLDLTRVAAWPKRSVWIDRYGRCVVNGKPIFPIGFYAGQVTEKLLRHFRDAGANVVMPYSTVTRKELDLCRDFGVMAFACVKQNTLHSQWAKGNDVRSAEDVDAYYRKTASEYRDHPAMFGWYAFDESPATDIPERSRIYRILCESDPDHVVWGVQDHNHLLRDYIPTCDVIGVDPYPVAKKPVSDVADFLVGTKKALLGDRPLWNVPQDFAWGWYKPSPQPDERFPTEIELRNMKWQHIASGANGLIGFSYGTLLRRFGNNATEFGRCWDIMSRTTKEIRSVEDILLSVEPVPEIFGARDRLPVRAWSKDGKLYVLAVNAENARATADLRISRGKWRYSSSVFGPVATVDEGIRLRIGLSPLDVSFVCLERQCLPGAAE